MKRLRELREEKRLYQKEVAKALGISRQAYNRYELGRRNPDNTMLIELATLFNVSIDYLLGYTNIKKPADNYLHEESKVYDSYTMATSHSLVNVSEEYLQLAREIQDANIKPEDIRTIIDILKRQNR